MPREKRDVGELRRRAINSLVLGIELFNRPREEGRTEGVLLVIHHAFEMLLKAIIRDKTGSVHEKEGRYTYGFDKCLEVAQVDLKMISRDERATLSILDAHRDTSCHYYQDVSEDILYLLTQASVTLFDDLINRAFGRRLANLIPDRVLPVSTRPPRDLTVLLDSELTQVDELLSSGRQGQRAAARLRSIVALATASRDTAERVTEQEIRRAIRKRREGEEWEIILPEIAQLRLDTEGEGIPIHLRIKKETPIAVRVARQGEPVVGTLVKHEINIWDKFNLGRDDLATKLGISGPRTSALIVELKIQEDVDCYRILRRKSSSFKGYSKKALDILKGALDSGLDVDAIWKKHRHLFGGPKPKEMSA